MHCKNDMFSRILSVVMIVLLLPLGLIISVTILVRSGLPIFYIQKRVGKGNIPFRFYKFRTMINDAEAAKKKLLSKNEASGPVFKIYNDPRFTVVGKFLSHTGLDELPQLINIVRGEMVFVGPRPLPVEEAMRLKTWQKHRHTIKPGIISPWVLNGYHKTTFDEWMKSDLAYIERKSMLYDTLLIIQAVGFFIFLISKELQRMFK